MSVLVVPFETARDLPMAVAAVREASSRHQIVAIPTESSYGLAVSPDDADGVAAVFELKGRAATKSLPVVAASLLQAVSLVEIPERWRGRLEGTWPAPLTVVLRSRRRSSFEATTLAVRVPAHPLLRSLLARVGPLTATSANRAGEPPALTAESVISALGSRVDLIVDGGRCPGGKPSTVIDLVSEPPRVLRLGAWAPDPGWGLKTV